MPKRADRPVAEVASRAVVVFAGFSRLAAGSLAEAAGAAWRAQHAGSDGALLVFDCRTGEVIDLDLRGTEAEVLARYDRPPSKPQRGRPSLGVVAREVTLLPRHWDWLARQPGGASATLRRIVEAARKSDAAAARDRTNAAYRFMAAVAGDLTGFEEAARALFAQNPDCLGRLVQGWPPEIRDELFHMLEGEP